MDEVIIVHSLSVKQVTEFFMSQVLRVNAVGPQELLVSHTEGLSERLANELGLRIGIKQEKHFIPSSTHRVKKSL